MGEGLGEVMRLTVARGGVGGTNRNAAPYLETSLNQVTILYQIVENTFTQSTIETIETSSTTLPRKTLQSFKASHSPSSPKKFRVTYTLPLGSFPTNSQWPSLKSDLRPQTGDAQSPLVFTIVLLLPYVLLGEMTEITFP